jgi:hypothetical protein
VKRASARSTIIGAVLLLCLPAAAFHNGGTGRCDGCHISHTDSQVGEQYLLIAESPSDVCLVCHSVNAGAVLGADPLAPPAEKGAGNFVFLLEENLNDAPDGMTNPIPGEAAGHSIVAPGRGLYADTRNSLSPGGSFPAGELGCTSCHDPHGNSNFRMLYGIGDVQNGLATFGFDAPVADGIGLGSSESPTRHSAYKSGVSDWCANCHGQYHDNGLSAFEHPGNGNLGTDISNQYNLYDGDDNPTGATFMTSHLPEVPFEDSAATHSTGSTAGPSATSKINCLSCHRAHASSAPHAGRWDFNVSLLAEDGIVSQSYPIPDPYGSPNQGTLCAKCHFGGAPAPEAAATRGVTGRTKSQPRLREPVGRVPR